MNRNSLEMHYLVTQQSIWNRRNYFKQYKILILICVFGLTFLTYYFLTRVDAAPVSMATRKARFVSWVNLLEVDLDWSSARSTARGNVLPVVFVNSNYVSNGLLPNLLCSRRLNAASRPLLAVAVDAPSAAYLRRHYGEESTHYSAEFWNGTSGSELRAGTYVTVEYSDFIARRTLFLRRLMRDTRLDVLVTDADTVWLADPVARIGAGDGCSVLWTDDAVWHDRAADPRTYLQVNAGFYLVRYGGHALRLFDCWMAAEVRSMLADEHATKEQEALRECLGTSMRGKYAMRTLGEEDMGREAAAAEDRPARAALSLLDDESTEMCVLPQPMFPSGRLLFLDGNYKSYTGRGDMRAVVVAHPNTGPKEQKIDKLRNRGWYFLDQCPDLMP